MPGGRATWSCGTIAKRCTAPAASTTATRSATCAAPPWPATPRRSNRRLTTRDQSLTSGWKWLNVSDLFPPSCQKVGEGGNKLCNPGLNFSVGRSRNLVLVNRAFQPKREIHLYLTCNYRWRKIDEQLGVVSIHAG